MLLDDAVHCGDGYWLTFLGLPVCGRLQLLAVFEATINSLQELKMEVGQQITDLESDVVRATATEG